VLNFFPRFLFLALNNHIYRPSLFQHFASGVQLRFILRREMSGVFLARSFQDTMRETAGETVSAKSRTVARHSRKSALPVLGASRDGTGCVLQETFLFLCPCHFHVCFCLLKIDHWITSIFSNALNVGVAKTVDVVYAICGPKLFRVAKLNVRVSEKWEKSR
jgi:hypothetical protein